MPSSIESEDEKRAFATAMDMWRDREYEGALRIFDELCLAHADHYAVITMRGWALHQLGRLPEAIAAFERAISACPTHERASLGLFHSRWKHGLEVEALDEMKRYLTLASSEEYEVLRGAFRRWLE